MPSFKPWKLILTQVCLAAGLLPLGLRAASPPERITVSGTEFRVCNGTQRIWMGGGNTPWFLWNDFGNASFDINTWSNHYQTLAANKINSSRVWITCDGEVGINISAARASPSSSLRAPRAQEPRST